MSNAKLNAGQLKTELKILKRENAALVLSKGEYGKRVRSELKACQDSQKQLAANCKHYRGRISALEDTAANLDQSLFLSDTELRDADTKVAELQVAAEKNLSRYKIVVGVLVLAIATGTGVEAATYLGFL